MKMKHSTLGQFLLPLLRFYGVDHAYGVDGDAVIRIRKEFDTFGKIANITCAHESTAAFSAEVYGRMKTLGCFYATYNAGINNALNAIDEGYLHNSALIVIGGEPSMQFRTANPCLHHHQLRLGEFDDQLKLLAVKLGKERVKSITDLSTAAKDITILVGKAVKDRLPVYLGVPSDAWDKEISYDKNEIENIKTRYWYALNCTEPKEPILGAILEMLSQSIADMKRPIISVGHAVKEFGLLPETVQLAERLKLPVVARFNGYGTFPVEHPLFVGTYNGPASVPPSVRGFAENTADRIDIGVLETDLNFALQTETVKLPPAAIMFDPRGGRILVGKYLQVQCNREAQSWLITRLSEILEPRPAQIFLPFASWVQERDASCKLLQKNRKETKTIRVSDIAPILNDFLKNKDMPMVADVGDAMFITLSILPSLPSRITYTSVFAAMGIFAGCIGLEHATGKRPLVLVGDGAFCMGETYSLMLTGAKPVIIILNNGGWSMMRQLRGENSGGEKSADQLLWPPTIDFRADAVVSTAREFQTALKKASEIDAPFIIDLRLYADDKSEPLLNFKDVRR